MGNIGQTRLISADTEKYGILFDLLRRSSEEEEVLVRELLSRLGKERYDSLLDIGAGDGSITQRLMSHFGKVTAIDRLDSNIYFLKSLGIDAERCLWEVYQTEKLFDIILASHIMYYFPSGDWVKEIVRMNDRLKPKGQMFVVVNSREGEYADFLKKFYSRFHETEMGQIHSAELVRQLGEYGIGANYSTLRSKVTFENKEHFLALCKFLIDYDFEYEDPLRLDLNRYYESLTPLEDKQRRTLTILEDLITIQK